MVCGRVRMILGAVVCAVLPVGQVMAQDSPTVYRVVTDSNGNTVATQTLPDGTVQSVDLSQNGIVLDPGDVGREFTVAKGAAPAPKGGGGPALDVAQIREQAALRQASVLKEELGCTDEELSVLKPLIQAIQLLQSVLGERPKGIGDKGASVPMPSVMAAVTDLRARQADFGRSIVEKYAEQEIKSRMVSLRGSRERARQELAKLRKELTDLLTIRQEAVLLQKQILE